MENKNEQPEVSDSQLSVSKDIDNQALNLIDAQVYKNAEEQFAAKQFDQSLKTLDAISPKASQHPVVLLHRWRCQFRLRQFFPALDTAYQLKEKCQNDKKYEAQSLMCLALALRQTKKAFEAWMELRPLCSRKLPQLWYVAASCALQVGATGEAVRLLKKYREAHPPGSPVPLSDPAIEKLLSDIDNNEVSVPTEEAQTADNHNPAEWKFSEIPKTVNRVKRQASN